MRRALALAVVALIALGCGGAPLPARSSSAPPAGAPIPLVTPGARFDLEQTIEERRDGELVRTRRARVLLQIGEPVDPDGTFEARALVIFTEADGVQERLRFDLRVDSDLRTRDVPIARCEGHARNDEASRIVRHVLHAVPRPRAAAPPGSTFSGALWDERLAAPVGTEARLAVREPGRVRITAEAQLALDGEPLAGAIVTGPARARVMADLDDSLLAGTTRTRIEAEGVREGTAVHVSVDERIVAVRGRREVPASAMCERYDPSVFDARLVVRYIQTIQAPIRACYENRLRVDHSLAGSVWVRMTILEDGTLSDVEAIENGTGNESLAACLVGVLLGGPHRFSPGPVGGSVTFQFPFVFEPEN